MGPRPVKDSGRGFFFSIYFDNTAGMIQVPRMSNMKNTAAPLIDSMSIELFDNGQWEKVEISFITKNAEWVKMLGPRSTITVRDRHCRNFTINGVKAVMPDYLETFQKGFSVQGL